MSEEQEIILRGALSREGISKEEEQSAFCAQCEIIELYAGASLLAKGAVCQQLGYLLEGAMIRQRMNANLDSEIGGLFVTNDWVLDPQSFARQAPATYEIVAYQPSVLAVIDIHQIHALIAQSQRYLILGKLLMSDTLPFPGYEKGMTPQDKYRGLLAKRPQLLAQFPLKHIASNLGMTPETLSRVRRKLAEGSIS